MRVKIYKWSIKSSSNLFNMIHLRINEAHIGEQLYFEDGGFLKFMCLEKKKKIYVLRLQNQCFQTRTIH